jgi:hypothetical protein
MSSTGTTTNSTWLGWYWAALMEPRTSIRQTGHVVWPLNQRPTQSPWNECIHTGRSFTISPSSTVLRHIEHSIDDPLFTSSTLLSLYGNVGRAAMAAESRPPVLCFSSSELCLVVVRKRNHRIIQMTMNTEPKTIMEIKICWKTELLLLMSGYPVEESVELLPDMVKISFVFFFFFQRTATKRDIITQLDLDWFYAQVFQCILCLAD